MKSYIIHCMTGCTCCNNENHTRGFYLSKESAERRVEYWLYHPDRDFPIASQFAPRGRYSIQEVELEHISKGRVIVGESLLSEWDLIETTKEGKVDGDDRLTYGGLLDET